MLFKLMEEGLFAPRNTMDINGVEVDPIILGEPASPLIPWLMGPHAGHVDRKKEHFTLALVAAEWRGSVHWAA